MKNAMQLKAIMKKLAKENQISAQLVLQNYMLERFLERVSLSPYRDNYLYGGAELQSDNGYGCNHKGLSSYAGCRPKNDRADSHRSC